MVIFASVNYLGTQLYSGGTDRLVLSIDNRYRKTVNFNISTSNIYSLFAMDGDNMNSTLSLNVYTDNKTIKIHNANPEFGGADMFYWFALTK